jgi:hypothetical protein
MIRYAIQSLCAFKLTSDARTKQMGRSA